MRVSTRGGYGVRAMLDLAFRYDQGAVSLRTVADRERISESYLEQLFRQLRRAGLVVGVRGARGGYCLARRPEEIVVGEIFRVLEGPIAPTDCVAEDAPDCRRASNCVTRLLWLRLRDSMISVLDTTTLGDLCREGRNMTGEIDRSGQVDPETAGRSCRWCGRPGEGPEREE